MGKQIASIIYIAIDLHNSEIAKKIVEGEFKYKDILNYLQIKKIELTHYMALPLLFLFYNNQDREEFLENKRIHENKFNKIVDPDRLHYLYGTINLENENDLTIMQEIGKKISQSKNLYK